jgi:hypothetical protein
MFLHGTILFDCIFVKVKVRPSGHADEDSEGECGDEFSRCQLNRI